ncbi:hypothetical protein L195_g047071, partial [Trifolium pratense]
GPMEDRNLFFMEDIHQWIQSNLRKGERSRNGVAWCVFWETARHCLWMWLNKELHDEDFTRIVQHVNKRVEDYYQARSANELMKLKESGCSGIIRGRQGEWLDGIAKGVGSCIAFLAELWVVQAIKKGSLNSPAGTILGEEHSTANGVGVRCYN